MATEDVMYRESSQFRLWSFNKAQLAAKREGVNAYARKHILARLVAERSFRSSSNSSNPGNPGGSSSAASSANTPNPAVAQGGGGGGGGGGGTKDSGNGSGSGSGNGGVEKFPPDFLTPAEEAVVATHFTVEIIRAAKHTNLDDATLATAAIFFRRFYVANSVMTYNPRNMLWVALFVGCKAEGNFVLVDSFGPEYGVKDPRGSILAGEYLLCLGLRFALDVKHPFRALRGAGMELRRMGGLDEARIEKAEKRARDILRWSPLITDAYFHYTPSQIMLAALSLADRELAERLVQKTFHYVPPVQQDEDGANATGTGANTPVIPSNGGGPAGGRKNQPPGAKDKDGGKNSSANLEDMIGPRIRDKALGTVEACRDMLARELPERGHWANKNIVETEIQPLLQKMQKCRDPDRFNVKNLQRIRQEQRELKRAARRAGNGGDSDDEVDDDDDDDDGNGKKTAGGEDDDDDEDDAVDPDESSSEEEAAARRRRRKKGIIQEDAAVFGDAAVGGGGGGGGGSVVGGSGSGPPEAKRLRFSGKGDPFGGAL